MRAKAGGQVRKRPLVTTSEQIGSHGPGEVNFGVERLGYLNKEVKLTHKRKVSKFLPGWGGGELRRGRGGGSV